MLINFTSPKLLIILLVVLTMVFMVNIPAWASLGGGTVGFDEYEGPQRGVFCYNTVDSSAPVEAHLNSVYVANGGDMMELGWIWDTDFSTQLSWFVTICDNGVWNVYYSRNGDIPGTPSAGGYYGLKIVSTAVNSKMFGAYIKNNGTDWEKKRKTFTYMKTGMPMVGTEREYYSAWPWVTDDPNNARWRDCQRLANYSGAPWQLWTSPVESPAPADADHDKEWTGAMNSSSDLWSVLK